MIERSYSDQGNSKRLPFPFAALGFEPKCTGSYLPSYHYSTTAYPLDVALCKIKTVGFIRLLKRGFSRVLFEHSVFNHKAHDYFLLLCKRMLPISDYIRHNYT